MKTVYFDIDTQLDFVSPSGALYVPGAELVLPNIAALNRAAAKAGSTVVSTTDAHSENDLEFRQWPAHCVAGTLGQRKPESTLLTKRIVIPSADVAERIDGFEQIVLEKQHLDCFTNPNLPGLLEAFQAERFIVYGVVSEICVRFAAFGLLKTGKRVDIVEDAVRALDTGAAQTMLEEFRSLGGGVVQTAAIA